MRSAVSLLVLLLAVSVQAADWRDNSYPDTTVITSLPYTIPSNNRVYVLNGNLTSNDGGIDVNSRSNIKIDGRGHTITFDRDGSGGVVGLALSNYSNHIVIANLTLEQAENPGEYGSPGGSNCTGIAVGYCSYVYVYNTNAHVRGHSSMCVDGGEGNHQAIEFNGGNYTSYTRSFDSRHQSDAAAFKLADGDPAPDTTFHYYVHNIRIDSACHAGVLIGGIAWVDSNFVNIDTYNQKPATSWANAHAIADAGSAWGGSHFRYNTIRTGSRHYGGRGMYFNFSSGTTEKPVEVAYNDIRVNQGYTTEADAARGMRIRWGCFGLRVHHNYFEVICDDDPSTLHIGSEAHGIWFSATAEEGAALGGNNWFYNNTISAMYYGDPANAPGTATCFIADVMRDPAQPFGNGNRSFNNHFKSNLRCIQLGEEGEPGNEWTSVNDTIEFLAPQYTDGWGFKGSVGVGAGAATALNSWLIDPVFINCDESSVTNRSGGGSKSVYVSRGVEVQVTGSDNGLPIQNATVRVFSRYNNPDVLSSAMTTRTTNYRGVMVDTIPYHFRRWEGYTLSSDSGYNNYVIRVDALGKTASTTVTLRDIQAGQPSGNVVVAIQLDTLGTGSSNTPPSPPSVSSPIDGATVGNLRPALIVNNGSDANGDQLTYEFQLYNAAGTTVLYSLAGIAQTPSTTAWTVPADLAIGTTYRWRARCSDGLENSTWTTLVSFTIGSGEDNTPPDAPLMHSPQIGAALNDLTPTLSVINAFDADYDALTYFFELYDAAGATLVASASAVPQGPAYTTWTVEQPLADGQTYSWRVRCHDRAAYSPWTSLAQFSIDMSIAIGLPVHSSPVNGASVVGAPVVLIVDNAPHDHAVTGVTYDFFVYNDQGATLLQEQILDVAETVGKTSATLASALQHGHIYWWRVRAGNGADSSALTAPTPFTFYSFGAGEEAVPTVAFPPDGGIADSRRPILGVTNITTAGTHSYYFELAADPGFNNLVGFSGQIAQDPDGVTRWQTDTELDAGAAYYWHVRADQYAFSPTFSFQVEEQIYAYPNPVHSSGDGLVTFQLPDEPVDLLIQTVSGQTVMIQNDISGDWQWDLRNAAGNGIAVGTYLWYVSGTNQRGKIVVLP